MGGAQAQWEKRAKLAEKRMDLSEKRGAFLDKRIEATWKRVESARRIVTRDRAYFKAFGKRLVAFIRKRREQPSP